MFYLYFSFFSYQSATILSCTLKFVLTLSLVYHAMGNRIIVIIKVLKYLWQ